MRTNAKRIRLSHACIKVGLIRKPIGIRNFNKPLIQCVIITPPPQHLFLTNVAKHINIVYYSLMCVTPERQKGWH